MQTDALARLASTKDVELLEVIPIKFLSTYCMMGDSTEEDSRPRSWSVSTSQKGTTYLEKFMKGFTVTTLGGSHSPIKYWDKDISSQP